jgi:hypothetical protein
MGIAASYSVWFYYDNDLFLLVCYCARSRSPCFRLFAFLGFYLHQSRPFFHVFLSALLLWMFNCYSTATFLALCAEAVAFFFFFFSLVLFLGCCTTLYTHTSIIEDLSACAFVELGRTI